ncbi:MAG: hypothetical protein JKY00_09935 [Roseicyclus sp.]|nr:hypothetical protein [Roseicyclus sp.]
MKGVTLAIGLAIAAAPPVHAQTIRVQSGDHAGFTRLVLSIGADREWALDQEADGQWVLALSPTVDGFDTSTSFDLIQRARLADLTGGETLTLDLACACDVSSFRHNSQYLVIDITDPDPNAPTPEQIAQDRALSQREEERAAAAAALPNLANLLLSPGILPSVPAVESVIEATHSPESQGADTPNPRLAEAAEIMAEQLARAAAAGLLDAALNQPMTFGDPVDDPVALPTLQERAETPLPGSPAPAPAPALENENENENEGGDHATTAPHVTGTDYPAGPLPIRAETAFDPAIPLDLPLGPPRTETACNNVPFSMADWSDGNGLDHNLGGLRRDLYDARDVLTADGALELARHYLYYGFGAEATYWLTQLPDPPEDLLRIALLVDGATTAPFPLVGTAEECSPGELLWHYFAGSVPGPLTPDDTAAIQRAFGELPAGLRDNMGPRLAQQLFEDGHRGTARNIRDVLHRGGRMEPATLRLLDLVLDIAPDSSADQTREALAEALRDDGGDPATIMAHALAFDRSIGERPNPSRLVAADALIREIGDGPETDDLWREILLGHAALGQIDEAINRLGDPVRSDSARAEALTDLIAERVTVDDTAALVVLAYTYGRHWRPEGSAAGRIQVRAIAALREEGLFEAAQILRDVRRPLILPAPEAAPPEPEDPARLAWAAGDWTRLAETGIGSHAAIATRLARLEGPSPDRSQPPPLPDLNSLTETVDDSRALRSTIADLLAQPSPP